MGRFVVMINCAIWALAASSDLLNATARNSPFHSAPACIMTMKQFQNHVLQHDQQLDSMYVCDTVNNTGIGLTSGGTFEFAFWAHPSELAPYIGAYVTHILFYHYDGSATGTAKIYNGLYGDTLTTEPYTPMIGWTDIALSFPVHIVDSNLVFSIEATHAAGAQPGGCDAGPHVPERGDWIYYNGSWTELYTYGLDYNWQIIVIVDSITLVDHDVSCVSIIEPPTRIVINSLYHPTACFANYGDNDETFEIFFTIHDAPGSPVYRETDTIFLPSLADTSVTFPDWYVGFTSYQVYTCSSYTLLAGDENPANDTVVQKDTVYNYGWTILDPPVVPHASSGHSCASTNETTYWMMNIQTTSGFIPDCDLYDINTNTWTASATVNPFGAGSYGTANAVNGKIYCIGGTVSWPNPLRRVHIYDPVNDQWTQGTDAPTGLLDHAAAVYMDRYIITFGNGNWGMTPTNEVYVYDTETDTWACGTAFPGTARGAAAFAVIDWSSWDNYVVGACGYKQDGTYGNDYIVGSIDPYDPTQITWGNWQTIPGMTARYRAPYGQDGYQLWIINGQNGPFSDTWTYDPSYDMWWNWECTKPTPIANVAPLAIILGFNYWQIFVPSGYNGVFVNSHERFSSWWGGIKEHPSTNQPITLWIAPIMNPVRGHVPITFSNNRSLPMQCRVYDGTGRVVRTIVDGRTIPPGTKTVFWNGKDDTHRDVPSGIYFLHLEAGSHVATRKIVFIR